VIEAMNTNFQNFLSKIIPQEAKAESKEQS